MATRKLDLDLAASRGAAFDLVARGSHNLNWQKRTASSSDPPPINRGSFSQLNI